METTIALQFQKLVGVAVERHASDLHLILGSPPTLRAAGELLPLDEEKLVTPEFVQGVVAELLSPAEQERLNKDRQIVVARTLGKNFRFKVSIFYQKDGLSVSLRSIPSQVPPLRELGLPKKFIELTAAKKGLVVITGPFDGGKSTTAVAFLEAINREQGRYIMTIEEPVEYLFTSAESVIEQREVGRDVLSFAAALQLVKQEDVEVVYVSQIPDQLTLRNVLEVTESGRLVVIVTSSVGSVRALEELIHLYPERERDLVRSLLAEHLLGVLHQRLLPRTGSSERVLVPELLLPSPAVRAVLREGNLSQLINLLQTSAAEGMISFDRALSDFVRSGTIALTTALREAQDPEAFTRLSGR